MLPSHWSLPLNVGMAITRRTGGYSLAPWDSLNLGDHVGDNPMHVVANRLRLQTELALPALPAWLNQVHGTSVLELPLAEDNCADGSFSRSPHQVCTVMTADCLPVLLCDDAGTQVAALHAGWRGLCDGILEIGVAKFSCPPAQVRAYFGPCIGPSAFEVGSEVRAAFISRHADDDTAFTALCADKYLADLAKLAELRLARVGVQQFFHSHQCTFTLKDEYFSYRRDGVTGRQASLIWLKD
ncbi:peptidoglycan editing factor PgeF [Shewanella sp. NIFS-20-20]|uniref:peptidoglycan editing factor PgeF n=1 Tax=Shewanella sp. NIFS-20-20 TaxID=2853806 RepID=UPI001C43EE3E|nr:peptidoglycan editing factor PgeF [Shewanella sp. NIFS-20-20]MBV7315965.1 peptidoglycan editing factor PgeF [Shewanella sp. NIFS-20-20]